MKLQKLCYYSQAWSLVWDEEPLFKENIEAWALGPVVPELYLEHKGQFKIDNISRGNIGNLNNEQKESIDNVIKFYDKYNAQQLSDITHSETPWKDARRRDGIQEGKRGNAEILHADMYEYYGSLDE